MLSDPNTFHAIILGESGASVGFVLVNGLARDDPILELNVRDFNDQARRLYESEEFKIEGRGEDNLIIYSLTPAQS